MEFFRRFKFLLLKFIWFLSFHVSEALGQVDRKGAWSASPLHSSASDEHLSWVVCDYLHLHHFNLTMGSIAGRDTLHISVLIAPILFPALRDQRSQVSENSVPFPQISTIPNLHLVQCQSIVSI